jgi:hypothetical protein
VEQLSIPYRIALVALVVIAPLYFLVLKPKSDTAAPVAATPAAVAPAAPASTGPAAPGVKGLTTAIDKAKGAVATQARSDAATQAATGASAAKPAATAVKPAAAAAAKPAAAATAKPAVAAAKPAHAATTPAASADPSAPILAAIDRGHTEVILFAGSSATDDRAVRAAVRRIRRHRGKVDVHVVPISRVGRYEAITRGVTVQQAPTVVVIGAKKAARTIVGFTTTAELNQLVGDVRRSG